MPTKIHLILLPIFLLAWLVACQPETKTLRLATTTSTYDSGLLDSILPDFEAQFGVTVNVVAVGTGQALALGESGDVDVVLVHAPEREEAFVAAGHGDGRFDVMYNDFIIVGPPDDPANIVGMSLANDALSAIANAEATFASRGDDSGTHIKEQSLWAAAQIDGLAEADWYKSLGQGMGETLRFANETAAYTITDRGTFLALKESLPNLIILVGGDSIAENEDTTLFNPYGVIPVSADKGNINSVLAMDFVDWLTAVETQQKIAQFGIETMNQPLFYPNSAAWNNQTN